VRAWRCWASGDDDDDDDDDDSNHCRSLRLNEVSIWSLTSKGRNLTRTLVDMVGSY